MIQKSIEANSGITRFSTAGDVDNGKSTLIGRLLLDQGAIAVDQLEALAGTKLNGDKQINLAHVTDGLKEERELGITIDVAYRYFSRNGRDFIVADTPGHREFTRNMFTGTSTSDAAVILVDAKNGVVEQNRRHLYITGILNTPHVFLCINKMDLVEFSEGRFRELSRELKDLTTQLSLPRVEIIPISALHGDNVVESSARMPWYSGGTLMQYLEKAGEHSPALQDFRFLVQLVRSVREGGQTNVELIGHVASGAVNRGESIRILPRNEAAVVRAIRGLQGSRDHALAPHTAGIILTDSPEVKRGDTIVRSDSRLQARDTFNATICWMDEASLDVTKTYLLKIGPNLLPATVSNVLHRINISNFTPEDPSDGVRLNDIASVRIQAASAVMFDPYRQSRKTGSFILIDSTTRKTAAAGTIGEIIEWIERQVPGVCEGVQLPIDGMRGKSKSLEDAALPPGAFPHYNKLLGQPFARY